MRGMKQSANWLFDPSLRRGLDGKLMWPVVVWKQNAIYYTGGL